MRFPQLLRPDSPYLLLDLKCQDNDLSTTVDDSSNYNYDAAFSNGYSQDRADIGPGLPLGHAFNGTTMLGVSDLISFSQNYTIPLGAEWTIQWFAKRDSTANTDIILCVFEDASYFGYQSGGHTIYFDADGASAQTLSLSGIVNTTTWHHVAMVFNSNNTISVYINGVSAGNLSDTRASAALFSVLTDGTASFFSGLFCGFKVYQQARTSTQIAIDASDGQLGPATKQLEFSLQDNTGTTTLDDTSLYNEDGFLSVNNASYYSAAEGPGNLLPRSFDGPTLASEGDALNLLNRYTFTELNGDWTFECFFRLTTNPASLALTHEYDGDTGFEVTVSGGNFVFSVPGTAATATAAGADTRWHHLVIFLSYDGALNGYLDAKKTLDFDYAWSGNILIDDLASWLAHSALNGRFCGYRIYNRILTFSEVSENAKRGAIGRICPSSLSLLGVG